MPKHTSKILCLRVRWIWQWVDMLLKSVLYDCRAYDVSYSNFQPRQDTYQSKALFKSYVTMPKHIRKMLRLRVRWISQWVDMFLKSVLYDCRAYDVSYSNFQPRQDTFQSKALFNSYATMPKHTRKIFCLRVRWIWQWVDMLLKSVLYDCRAFDVSYSNFQPRQDTCQSKAVLKGYVTMRKHTRKIVCLMVRRISQWVDMLLKLVLYVCRPSYVSLSNFQPWQDTYQSKALFETYATIPKHSRKIRCLRVRWISQSVDVLLKSVMHYCRAYDVS